MLVPSRLYSPAVTLQPMALVCSPFGGGWVLAVVRVNDEIQYSFRAVESILPLGHEGSGICISPDLGTGSGG